MEITKTDGIQEANQEALKTGEKEPGIQTEVVKTEENANDKPFKTFATEADFNRHSVGILNSAKNKAEKELLAMLGLKPDEKDKLAKFKEAYDNTLSEAEKQAKNISALTDEVNTLKNSVSEKEAIILALSQMTGKNAKDVSKIIAMAKGLVSDDTTLEDALKQVFELVKVDNKPLSSKPLKESSTQANAAKDNPFKSGNLTEQGKLIKSDREKAREMYFAVYGKHPSW